MLDLAHVTDLHLVERRHRDRTGADWHRLQMLSVGRTIEYASRKEKAVQALRRASRNAAHVIVTGDLTEDGVPAQFELLAEVLDEAGIDPGRLTLVPGNHDRYADAGAFERALSGPLRRYAAASRSSTVLPLGRDAWLMPVSTAVAQSCLRSAGRMSSVDVDRIDQLARAARRARKLALVAQHHPPHGHGGPAWNWIDGLVNAAVGRALLHTHERLQFIHGHTHKLTSAVFGEGRPAQAHSGAAAVASSNNVRYYRITNEALIAVDPIQPPAFEPKKSRRSPAMLAAEPLET
jgi:3',5'-cyclic-AMP phosphodiesterase